MEGAICNMAKGGDIVKARSSSKRGEVEGVIYSFVMIIRILKCRKEILISGFHNYYCY
jgi:hypothetical protein